MAEYILPDPLLVDYVQLSNSLWTGFDNVTEFFTLTDAIGNDEWHYIMSKLEQNIFLLKRLQELNLLKNHSNICDAGIGLGAALFDLYLQSKKIENHTFTFYGIEKNEKYLEFFKEKLLHYWNGELNLIEDDLDNQNFSNYDIVYSYSPYRSPRKLLEFYTKIKDEIKPGSIIIENREKGLGLDNTMTMVEGLKSIKLDDIWIFQKI